MDDDRQRVIEDRLKPLERSSDAAQMHGARELLQELSLFALSRTDFFKSAAFMGGTALRIFYGLQRLSEDLDCSLQKPGKYDLNKLSEPILRELNAWGLETEFSLRDREPTVKIGWIKESSLGGLLNLQSPLKREQKIRVKLELDVSPPSGAKIEQKLGRFPIAHPVACHDLPSLFSGKLHALLCRPYAKGRDWYDLSFYLNKGVSPNLTFLHEALKQVGPHTNLEQEPSLAWIRARLLEQLHKFGLEKLKADVEPFIRDRRELELWTNKFFESELANLGEAKTLSR